MRMLSRLKNRWVTLKLRLQTLKLRLTPYESRWRQAQHRYVEWAKEELPPSYIDDIRKLGLQFADFIGSPGICLDVGCGNGLFGGMSYDEMGYRYLNKGADDTIIGIDPLPLEGEKPSWMDEYVMAVGEHPPFRDVFTKSTNATSFDHLLNHRECLKECASISGSRLYIWTTFFRKGEPDPYHPERQTRDEFIEMLTDAGLAVKTLQKVRQAPDHEIVFIKTMEAGR